MSWKHIFRTARRTGAPVILADEEGKHPMVIMSLDRYEDLLMSDEAVFEDFNPGGLDDEMFFSHDSFPSQGHEHKHFGYDFLGDEDFTEPRPHKTAAPDKSANGAFEAMTEPVSEPIDLPGFDISDQRSAEISQNTPKTPVDILGDNLSVDDAVDAEIPLEDRFIFESIDENQTN